MMRYGFARRVRGDAEQINIKRREVGKQEIEVEVVFRGIGAPCSNPDGSLVEAG